jgi:hypothetical protein
MNKIHTVAHIRTARMAKSYRACVSMTGKSQILAEYGRVCAEEFQRLNRLQQQQAGGKRILLRRAL